MDDKEKESSEEKLESMGDILKEFGVPEDIIEDFNPEKIKKAVADFGKIWSTKERLENEGEALKYSVRTIWSLLPSISALSAMLLVVATFNHDLIEITLSVRIILTILLTLIPFGLWGTYFDSKKGVESGLKRMTDILKEGTGKDISDQIKKLSKPSFLSFLPFFINFTFTLAIVLIILLIWKIDFLQFLIKIF